jgi:hypothetical protein
VIEELEDVTGEVEVEYTITLKEPWIFFTCELKVELLGNDTQALPINSSWIDENKIQWHHIRNGTFQNITREAKAFQMPKKMAMTGLLFREGA